MLKNQEFESAVIDAAMQYTSTEPKNQPSSLFAAPPEHCECCGKEIKRGREHWLVLDGSTGKYYEDEKDIPAGNINQGAFPFGVTCAKKILLTLVE